MVRPKRERASTTNTEPLSKKQKSNRFPHINLYALNTLSLSDDEDSDLAIQSNNKNAPSSVRDFVKHHRAILGWEEFDGMVRRGRIDPNTMCALSEKTRQIYSYPGLNDAQKKRLQELDASFQFSSTHKKVLMNKKQAAVGETKSKLFSLHAWASKEVLKIQATLSEMQRAGNDDPSIRREVNIRQDQLAEMKLKVKSITRHLTAGVKTKDKRELDGDHSILVMASTPAALSEYYGDLHGLEKTALAVGKVFGKGILRARVTVDFIFLFGHEQRFGMPEAPASREKDKFPNDNYAAEKKLHRFFRAAKESKGKATLLLLGETVMGIRARNIIGVANKCGDAHVNIAIMYHVEELAAKFLSAEHQKLFRRARRDAVKVFISAPMKEIVSAVHDQSSSPEARWLVGTWDKRYRDVLCHACTTTPNITQAASMAWQQHEAERRHGWLLTE